MGYLATTVEPTG